MILGKTIRIYLKDGSVSGVKLAELANHTIQAIACPRTKLAEMNESFKKEIGRPGVYFLLGEDEGNQNKVYIGESENVWERLKNHDTNKDFWNEVILVTSKDENLTKSHVRYLESKLLKIAREANRYSIENNNSSGESSLPLPDKDAMEDFIVCIQLLNGTLGHKFLELPIQKKNREENSFLPIDDYIDSSIKVELKSNGINARGIMTDEGILVLKKSEVSNKESRSYNYTALREKLVRNGVILDNKENKCYFEKDYLFKSPSAAASVILGYSANGRNIWKDKDNRTLNEIERIKVK